MRYRELQDFERSGERPFIHVVDGGVSDNLGLRGVLEGLEVVEASPAFRAGRRPSPLVADRGDRGERAFGADAPTGTAASAPGIVAQLRSRRACRSTATRTSSCELLKDMRRTLGQPGATSRLPASAWPGRGGRGADPHRAGRGVHDRRQLRDYSTIPWSATTS